MPTPENLARFLYDMLTDPAMRQRFNGNPEYVMSQEYELKPAQRRAIYSMDPQIIANAMKKVLHDFQMPDGEFPPLDEECLPAPGLAPEYPSPKPKVYRLRPSKVSKGGDLTNGKFVLVVRGQSFAPNGTTVDIVEDGGAGTVLTTAATATFGTYRCSGVRVVVSVPPSTPVGNYHVTVKINPGKPEEVVIPAAGDPPIKLEITA